MLPKVLVVRLSTSEPKISLTEGEGEGEGHFRTSIYMMELYHLSRFAFGNYLQIFIFIKHFSLYVCIYV